MNLRHLTYAARAELAASREARAMTLAVKASQAGRRERCEVYLLVGKRWNWLRNRFQDEADRRGRF